jgi:dipeptidyl-peptidase 4
VPVDGGETVWIDWDTKKLEYLTEVRWEKNGPLTITVQNRLQNELALLKVDPKTGKTTPLLTEKDSTWVNIDQALPRWLPDNGGFLWATETPKGRQLELRKPDGQFTQVLVTPENGFQQLIAVDSRGKELLYQIPSMKVDVAGGDVRESSDPTQSQVMRRIEGVTRHPLRTSIPITVLDHFDEGWQSAAANKDFSAYVATITTRKQMPRSFVFKRAENFEYVSELPSVAESPGFTPKVEFTKVGDNPGYYCAIVRPHGFNPKKKYPVIVDVYGGPGHQVVVQAMRNWLLPQWLADQGFIVVAIDNRGTPNRGRDWERALYQKFGTVPLEDQVAALQALGKKYPELDLDRVGIFGWSFGGYMAAQAVLKRPDIYKAAVAGAPVTDWLDYDTHYTERYLGLPEASPQAYKDASLLPLAGDLKRPLLLIHGTADDNVYFRHSLKLADALFRAGKDFELLPLSGLTHMANDPVAMERLYGRIAGHFQKHLSK